MEIFKHIDIDSSGLITRAEFIAFLKDCKGDEAEKTPVRPLNVMTSLVEHTSALNARVGDHCISVGRKEFPALFRRW